MSATSWPSWRPRLPTSWRSTALRRAGRRTRWRGALVSLAVGLTGAVLAYGYGLGTLRRPGAGLWPFAISMVIVVLSVALLVVGRHARGQRAVHPRQPAGARRRDVVRGVRRAAPGHRLRDPVAAAVRGLAEVPRRRVLAQHGRGQRRAPSPRSTSCSSTGCASRCLISSEEAAMESTHSSTASASSPSRRTCSTA